MKKDNKNADLERKLALYEGQIKRNPDNANNHYMKAGVLVELGQRTSNPIYHEQALVCYDKALLLSPENAIYLGDRSKLHALMGNSHLAARDITEAQKSGDTGNAVLNMYNTKTTKDILKLEGVQNEVSRMIKAGELPADLAAVFSDMIGVISGISARVSEHDDRLNEHDERFERDEAKLKEVEERLVEYERQYPALTQIIESMKEKIELLQSEMGKQEQKLKVHGKVIMSLQQASKIAEKVIEDLQEKVDKAPGTSSAENQAMKEELASLSKSVHDVFAKVAAQEKKAGEQDPLIEELVSGMQSLQTAKDLNTKMFLNIRKQIKAIEERIPTQESVKVGIVSGITYDNELLNHPELFMEVSKSFGMQKSLELGKYLSLGLIGEAVDTGDYSVILAGMMSLEHEGDEAA